MEIAASTSLHLRVPKFLTAVWQAWCLKFVKLLERVSSDFVYFDRFLNWHFEKIPSFFFLIYNLFFPLQFTISKFLNVLRQLHILSPLNFLSREHRISLDVRKSNNDKYCERSINTEKISKDEKSSVKSSPADLDQNFKKQSRNNRKYPNKIQFQRTKRIQGKRYRSANLQRWIKLSSVLIHPLDDGGGNLQTVERLFRPLSIKQGDPRRCSYFSAFRD